MILAFVLYGFVTWSRILTEERRLGAFENGMLRKIFRSKMEKVTGKCKNCIIWNCKQRPTQHVFLGSSNESGRVGRVMWHVERE
jgi:hypothetical protein